MLFTHLSVQGQNLVPNPGFETVLNCPSNHGQISLASPWITPTPGSPDLFNTCVGSNCSGGPFVCVPINWTGSQLPNTGNGYAGFFVYWDANNPEFREYIQTPLLTPLVAGVTYNVSFYVSLGDSSGNAINSVGAYLSDTPITNSSMDYFSCCTSQVNSSNVINSTNGWTMITGNFLASGNEQYLTIGNFNSSANTTMTSIPGGTTVHSYYYIDDVSVIQEDCEIILEMPNIFTPNNDGNNDLFIPTISKGIVSMKTVIFNRWGNKIFETNNLLIEWDGQDVSDGTYFWIVDYTDINGVKNSLKGHVTILK